MNITPTVSTWDEHTEEADDLLFSMYGEESEEDAGIYLIPAMFGQDIPGDCTDAGFSLFHDLCMQFEGATLCAGTCRRSAATGVIINGWHYWVECNGVAIDAANGQLDVMPRDEYLQASGASGVIRFSEGKYMSWMTRGRNPPLYTLSDGERDWVLEKMRRAVMFRSQFYSC